MKREEDEDSLEIDSDNEINSSFTPQKEKNSRSEGKRMLPKTMLANEPISKRMTSMQRALYSLPTAGGATAQHAASSASSNADIGANSEEEQPSSTLYSNKFTSPAKDVEKQIKRKLMRQEKLELTKQATVNKLLNRQQLSQADKRAKDMSSDSHRNTNTDLEIYYKLPPNTIRFVHNMEGNFLLSHNADIFYSMNTKPVLLEPELCVV